MRSIVPKLPRAAWLAIGAIVAALMVSNASWSGPLAAALVLASLIGVSAVVPLARMGRARGAALLLGLASVGLRAAVAGLIGGAAIAPAMLPSGSEPRTATVVDISSPSGAEQRATLRVAGPTAESAGWNVYAWLPRYPAIVPGDHVLVEGSLKARPSDGSGFADFLASRGVDATMRARTMRLIESGHGLMGAVEQLRWGIDGAMSRAIPEPEAGLAAGILVGLRERVGRSVADDFLVTGLTHVVAISGWNIALVAGIATGLLRATGMRRRARSLIVIAAIVAYTVIAGAEASVVRAAIMGGIVLLARESGRPSGAAAALGLACWSLLLVEPRMIEDIGLQLSLAATAGLLALGAPAEAAIQRLGRGRLPGWFAETLGVSLAAQLATLPLILLHFGRLSVISPLANLLVAPVVPFAMLGAFIGVLLGPLMAMPAVSVIAAPISLAAWLPLATMVRGASLLADVPLANLELASPIDLAGAFIALSALLLALRRVRGHDTSADRGPPPIREPKSERPRSTIRRLRAPGAVAVGALLVITGSVVLGARPADSLTVTVLDVGQGDAILLESDDGRRLLVDGGPDPDLLVRRLDERIPVWDRHIDLVVLTHPHEDHAGGLAGLAPRYRIDVLAETGMTSEGSSVTELRASAARHGTRRIRLARGDELRLGPALVSVVWPAQEDIPLDAPSSGRGINDTSIVLDVAIGRHHVLLTGDLEEDMDQRLLESLGAEQRRIELLKVAHHGSATATSQPLLEALRPRLAIISSGLDNRYGHPAPATMARLDGVGSTLWRTDTQGTFSTTLIDGARSAVLPSDEYRSASPCPPRQAARLARHSGPSANGGHACYARYDGGPHQNRSPFAAAVGVTVKPTHAARHRGGRGRIVSGLPHIPGRRTGRPTPGRHSRAPPRHRQGVTQERSRA